MKQTHLFISIVISCIAVLISGCATPPTPTATQAPPTLEPAIPTLKPVEPFMLTSTAFNDGDELTNKYVYSMGGQCSGENYSPPLAWTNAPENTKSFVITLVDPDGGNWVHWVQFNIPADVTSLEETVNGPKVGIVGRNDFYATEYSGPCPPGGTHRYIFTLYALDTMLELQDATNLITLLPSIKDHILGQVQLTGLRSR